MTSQPPDYEGPVIRDKRRFDPQTGALREPQVAAATAAPGPADEASNPTVANGAGSPPAADQPEEIFVQLAERTADLQRLQAEYVNYKRRVDRDREVARDAAKVSVLTALLPVLDDIGRAREHEELTGGFKAVAESLERTVTTQGLTAFGEVGDAFDPHRHEALMHHYSNEVAGPVCQAIVQVGYQFGERVVRPARVAVAEPADSIDIAPADGSNLVPTDASSAEPAEAISTEPGTESTGAAGRGAATS